MTKYEEGDRGTMESIQETLLQWYQQDVFRYAVVSTVAVFAAGILFGLAADVLTRLLGIGVERLMHKKETGDKR